MIRYSLRSRRAIARLMAPYNDLDIYVEDGTYVGVYERLVNRALRGHARVEKVIALGAREDVLSAALNDNAAGGRPRLYIVDGDLDLIAHLRQKRAPHLYRLRVYSLENLLFEERAIESYCAFVCPSLPVDEACKQIDIELISQEIDRKASSYILSLGVARRLDLRDDEFRIDLRQLFHVKAGKYVSIDNAKLFAKLKKIVSRIKQLTSEEAYRNAKKEVVANIMRRKLTGHDFVPGKFLLWYLNERAGLVKGHSLAQRVIASYLADHCTLTRDAALGRRLRRAARGQGA